ncbi:MAG: hypothetical protein HRU20_09110 [Pseudomonadales bacterium]|nr:hypothetical protein [Pseudomonadales bacterium]
MRINQCTKQTERLQLEIDVDKLESLLDKGELCAADLRCLNSGSKTRLWNLCLSTCARRFESP